MEEEMKVWKVTDCDGLDAPLFIAKMTVWDEVGGGIDYEETGNKYLMEVVEMEPDIFYNLPEWGGF